MQSFTENILLSVSHLEMHWLLVQGQPAMNYSYITPTVPAALCTEIIIVDFFLSFF